MILQNQAKEKMQFLSVPCKWKQLFSIHSYPACPVPAVELLQVSPDPYFLLNITQVSPKLIRNW